MGSRMKVLGVAPYEGMQSLMYKVAEEFPDIELSVFLGDLAAGVAVVQERMQENYDIVISRGGTAGLLRQQISIPVVEISFTVYDILPAGVQRGVGHLLEKRCGGRGHRPAQRQHRRCAVPRQNHPFHRRVVCMDLCHHSAERRL